MYSAYSQENFIFSNLVCSDAFMFVQCDDVLLFIAHSGKMQSPLGHRYLSALITQFLAHLLRKRKDPDSNPTVGKNFFHFVILGLRSSQVE